MWSGLVNQSALPALEQTVAFAQRRHLLLAGNIANLDVPGYRTRDLPTSEFEKALKESIEARSTQGRNKVSPGRHSYRAGQADSLAKVRDLQHQVLFLDGSDVNLEQQVTQISKNQMLHDTAIALMRSQFQTLSAAIRESANV
jgi:flagellar basal-body rod protein FlgB